MKNPEDEHKCRTSKCDETLKSDGHTKVPWSVPNPYGVTCNKCIIYYLCLVNYSEKLIKCKF